MKVFVEGQSLLDKIKLLLKIITEIKNWKKELLCYVFSTLDNSYPSGLQVHVETCFHSMPIHTQTPPENFILRNMPLASPLV